MTMPKRHLRMMLASTVMQSQTGGGAAAYALGPKHYCEVLTAAIEKEAPAIDDRWERALVSAWRTVVPPDILRNAAKLPPAAGALSVQPLAPLIGAEMMRAEQDDVVKVATAVSQDIVAEARQVDMKKVDQSQRVAELKAAAADGTVGCGFVEPARSGTGS